MAQFVAKAFILPTNCLLYRSIKPYVSLVDGVSGDIAQVAVIHFGFPYDMSSYTRTVSDTQNRIELCD